MTRQSTGGFEDRFRVTRTDGKPIDPARRYIILDYAGSDPHAAVALNAYADSIEGENPAMAADLRAGDFSLAVHLAHGAPVRLASEHPRHYFFFVASPAGALPPFGFFFPPLLPDPLSGMTLRFRVSLPDNTLGWAGAAYHLSFTMGAIARASCILPVFPPNS